MFGLKLACCAIFLNGLIYSAQTNAQRLTILLRFEHPGSAVATEAMENEVRFLLGKNTSVRFGTDTDAVQETSGKLVIVRMRGYCSMSRSVERQPPGLALGSTFVSDGTVLPFGQVECDRIRASLQRLSYSLPQESEQQLGQAMGRVLLHELYHMLSRTMTHTTYGLTKPSLSAFELSATGADLPRDSKVAMDMVGGSSR
ncbi:MAG: hypothetical protein ACJ746_04840 [Bryobacteraceae bacterium]